MADTGKQEPTLFILLGLDTLFSLNLSDFVKETETIELPIVFSHGFHKQPDDGSDFPLGMGLFVKDSKFHFFGGENMEDDPRSGRMEVIDFGQDHRSEDYDPEYDPVFGCLYKRPKFHGDWKNKKLFSFTSPILGHTLTPDNSTPLPEPFGYKLRPIVVTIKRKIYALGTRPYREYFGKLELKQSKLEENQFLFEVFEPKEDGQWQGEWHWRKLDNPPDPLGSSLLKFNYPRRIYHSVIKNKLFLQTNKAEYIFDPNEEKWICNNYGENGDCFVDYELDLSGMTMHNFTPCNDIIAYLEYEDHLLLFVDYKLHAYNLSSFKEFKGSKGSLDGPRQTILDVGYMVQKRRSTILAATLTLVDHNRICFVFSRRGSVHVCLLEFTEPPYVKVIHAREFFLPRVLISDTKIVSTYLLPHDEEILRKNNQVPTKEKGSKGEGCKEKACVSSCFHINVVDSIEFEEEEVSEVMPKLRNTEYYTEPSIEELEAKEKAEPGFCSHVKDFVIGRRDKGSIKFLGEIDIRKLDLESIVQFNDGEVFVYANGTEKPLVGKGLNGPAEITLLNVKCIDKTTGKLYTDGPQVERYKTALIKKSAEEGVDFVSYDPIQGVWKFSVQHF